MRWQLVRDAAASGAVNMARDLELAGDVAAGRRPPVLRLYAWEPPAVSLGRNQDPAEACDPAACTAAGWDVVRRPTGGRAVLHARDEVTYMVALPLEAAPPGVLAAYAWLARALVAAYRALGVPADLEAEGAGAGGRSGACFAAPARHEIVCGGRKLAGSAQVRRAGYLLQHGSLPLRLDAGLHARLLRLDAGQAKALAGHAAGLADFLRAVPTRAVVEQALVRGFQQALGVDFAKEAKEASDAPVAGGEPSAGAGAARTQPEPAWPA